jgi:hypothetical protein
MDKKALYPDLVNPTALVVGAIVKHLPYGSNESTEMTGVVTHIIPATSKVYVSWPNYCNTQHDASELLVITQGHGVESPLVFNTGYSSWEKRKSERLYGKVTPHGVVKVASVELTEEQEKVAKLMAKAASYKIIGYSRKTAEDMLKKLNPEQNPALIEAVAEDAYTTAEYDGLQTVDNQDPATIDNEPAAEFSVDPAVAGVTTGESVGLPTDQQ